MPVHRPALHATIISQSKCCDSIHSIECNGMGWYRLSLGLTIVCQNTSQATIHRTVDVIFRRHVTIYLLAQSDNRFANLLSAPLPLTRCSVYELRFSLPLPPFRSSYSTHQHRQFLLHCLVFFIRPSPVLSLSTAISTETNRFLLSTWILLVQTSSLFLSLSFHPSLCMRVCMCMYVRVCLPFTCSGRHPCQWLCTPC